MGYFTSYQIDGEFYCDITPDCTIVDSNSRIICAELNTVNCDGDCPLLTVNNGLNLCDTEDSWNCNLCGNDLPYSNLIAPGDPLQFQFQQPDLINGNSPLTDWTNAIGWDPFGVVTGIIRDCCTNEPLEQGGGAAPVETYYSIKNYVGIYGCKNYSGSTIEYTNIQAIELNSFDIYTDLLTQFPNGGGCFYIEWTFNPNDITNLQTFYSEPYRFVTCEDTVMLEGVYPLFLDLNNPATQGRGLPPCLKDCFGQYYALPSNWTGTRFAFRQFYRVPGVFEPASFEIQKEFVGSFLSSTSVNLNENWVLKTGRLPYRAARLVTSIFAAQETYVDGKQWTADGEINKNNDVGNQWFIEATLKRVNCSKSYSCN
jgi:hypothetical protein